MIGRTIQIGALLTAFALGLGAMACGDLAYAATPKHQPASGLAAKKDAPKKEANKKDEPPISAPHAILIDGENGAILFERDPDKLIFPASLAKLMTAEYVFHELKEGRIKLTDEYVVSENAWRKGGAPSGGSTMYAAIHSKVSVGDLLHGVIIHSGNDACIVLAEGIAGSEEGFAELMNKKAAQLGLTASNFRNCTGWPDPDHRMSVHDIAILARHIIQDFPEYYHYDSERSFKYNGIEQENRNPLVQKGTGDGLKTGHTEDGGYGLAASSLRGGRRVILVLNGMPSMRQRREEGERVMDWAFREFENVTLFSASDVVETAPVWLGSSKTVPLVGGRDLVVTMPRQWRRSAKVAIEYSTPVEAPVARGDALGRLTISGQGVPSMEVPLLAGADVARLNLPGRAMAVISRYVTGS
jgi:D-alanyl-D-alanine carboxypeptidase (penicillin-binding protein 5/6)